MPLRCPGWGSRGPRLALLLAATQLAACSGTPFGEQLSNSFSTPPPAEPATPSTASSGAAASAAAPTAPATPPVGGPAGQAQGAGQVKTVRAPRAPVLSPVPYRITIKLVGADPAAPAEAVTEALRAAGVPFEVEMIERMPGEAPVATPPAPPPAAAAPEPAAPAPAPAGRPAPAPR